MMGAVRRPELRQTREMSEKSWGALSKLESRCGSHVRRKAVQDKNRISL